MRLTDEQMLHIFKEIVRLGSRENYFLLYYAEAMTRAMRRDFMILRPASLILIAKHNLGVHLANFKEEPVDIAEHNFPGSRRSA